MTIIGTHSLKMQVITNDTMLIFDWMVYAEGFR